MGLNRFAREKDDNYSTICNRIMKEKNISLKAKGLYALVMSLPPEWDFSVQGIVAISKEESGAIYTAIKELIKEGYCERNMISEKGRFIGCEYKFFNKKKKPQEKEPHNEKPHMDFPHTENEEDNKLFNELNSSSINTPTELNNNKRLSNDNPKEDYPDDFLEFWEAYGLCRDKGTTYKRWKNLSKKDKEAALKALPDYFSDCKRCDRKKRYPAVYLSKRTWEDDFSTQEKEEEKEELPAGLTPETWALRQGWMYKFIPRIAERITPDMFLTLQGLSHFKPDVFKDIIEDIDKSDFNGDIVMEFDRLRFTENYANRIDL